MAGIERERVWEVFGVSVLAGDRRREGRGGVLGVGGGGGGGICE